MRVGWILLSVLLVPAAAPAATALLASGTPAPGITPASARALGRSRVLWATINVCNAPDQPDTVGVRGSMPGDGQSHDTLYMRFRLQYMDTTTKLWVDLSAAATNFIAVGPAKDARQGGGSFRLVPVAGKPAFILRGVVSFQWRHGRSVLFAISRPTTAGRQSLAGADPQGFSASTCQIE